MYRAPQRALPLILSLLLVILTSCSPNSKTESRQQGYRESKQLVMDVLQTQEGKKALKEIIREPDFKREIIISDQDVEKAITQSMTDPKMRKQLERLFEKPQVAASFAKATQKEQKDLFKQLMKDPEYQKMMLDLLKDPEFSKQLNQVMKSRENRKQMQKVMEEALESPTFKEKFLKLLSEAMKKPPSEKGAQPQGGGQEEGGGKEKKESEMGT